VQDLYEKPSNLEKQAKKEPHVGTQNFISTPTWKTHKLFLLDTLTIS
jgi:hypothetical protein